MFRIAGTFANGRVFSGTIPADDPFSALEIAKKSADVSAVGSPVVRISARKLDKTSFRISESAPAPRRRAATSATPSRKR